MGGYSPSLRAYSSRSSDRFSDRGSVGSAANGGDEEE